MKQTSRDWKYGWDIRSVETFREWRFTLQPVGVVDRIRFPFASCAVHVSSFQSHRISEACRRPKFFSLSLSLILLANVSLPSADCVSNGNRPNSKINLLRKHGDVRPAHTVKSSEYRYRREKNSYTEIIWKWCYCISMMPIRYTFLGLIFFLTRNISPSSEWNTVYIP